MFSQTAPAERVEQFAVSMSQFHPAGFRAMARACAAADLREILRGTDVPTLPLYGDENVPAPLPVGQDLHAAVPGSRLVVMPGVGHLSSVEAEERSTARSASFFTSPTLIALYPYGYGAAKSAPTACGEGSSVMPPRQRPD